MKLLFTQRPLSQAPVSTALVLFVDHLTTLKVLTMFPTALVTGDSWQSRFKDKSILMIYF